MVIWDVRPENEGKSINPRTHSPSDKILIEQLCVYTHCLAGKALHGAGFGPQPGFVICCRAGWAAGQTSVVGPGYSNIYAVESLSCCGQNYIVAWRVRAQLSSLHSYKMCTLFVPDSPLCA